MIDYSKTKLDHFSSRPAPAATDHGIVEDGQALVSVNSGGISAVKASTGATGEKFFGFALGDFGTPTQLGGVINVTGTGAQFTTNIPNYVADTAIVIAADGTAEADELKVAVGNDGTVTVKAAAGAGEVFTIRYSYSPTVAEAQTLFGELESNISPLSSGAEPGVFRHGLIYISNFDTSSDWAINDVPKLGTNGTLTKTGTGATATGVMVAELPSVGQGYLGLEVSL